jgi:hypothetical protein
VSVLEADLVTTTPLHIEGEFLHRGRVPSYFDWQEVEEGNGQLSHFFKNMTVFFMWMP